jgi:hypothetical protein
MDKGIWELMRKYRLENADLRQLMSHPAWLILLEKAIERQPHESVGVPLETLEDLRDKLVKIVEGN